MHLVRRSLYWYNNSIPRILVCRFIVALLTAYLVTVPLQLWHSSCPSSVEDLIWNSQLFIDHMLHINKGRLNMTSNWVQIPPVQKARCVWGFFFHLCFFTSSYGKWHFTCGFISDYSSTSQSINEGTHQSRNSSRQSLWKNAAYWLVSHDLLHLIFYILEGHHPQWARTSHINHQSRKYPTGFPTYLSFSAKVPSSQITLACIKLT